MFGCDQLLSIAMKTYFLHQLLILGNVVHQEHNISHNATQLQLFVEPSLPGKLHTSSFAFTTIL